MKHLAMGPTGGVQEVGKGTTLDGSRAGEREQVAEGGEEIEEVTEPGTGDVLRDSRAGQEQGNAEAVLVEVLFPMRPWEPPARPWSLVKTRRVFSAKPEF